MPIIEQPADLKPSHAEELNEHSVGLLAASTGAVSTDKPENPNVATESIMTVPSFSDNMLDL